MSKRVFMALAAAMSIFAVSAARVPDSVGFLRSQRIIGSDRQFYPVEEAVGDMLRAPEPPNARLDLLAISVTGLTQEIDGATYREVILYYYFNWDATGYHPYVRFSDVVTGPFVRLAKQDDAENVGSTTLENVTYPYTWRSRCWVPIEKTTGFFDIYCPTDQYDGDDPVVSEYSFMTNGVHYVRKGQLSRSAMVVTNFNPAAFTVFTRKTTLTPLDGGEPLSVTRRAGKTLADATPIIQDTTDYTFDAPVKFNNLVYFTDWSSLRVGTNNLGNVLAGLAPADVSGCVMFADAGATIPQTGTCLALSERYAYFTNTTETVEGGVTNIVTTVTTNSYSVVSLYKDGTKVWTSDPADASNYGWLVALIIALVGGASTVLWKFFGKSTYTLKVDPETGGIYYDT